MTPAQILDKAADEMLERGLARNTYYDNSGQVCIYGACLAAKGLLYKDEPNFLSAKETTPIEDAVTPYLVRELHEQYGLDEELDAVIDFNDGACRDKEEAALVLRGAAKRAEAEQ
jgi:hypothetical protein